MFKLTVNLGLAIAVIGVLVLALNTAGRMFSGSGKNVLAATVQSSSLILNDSNQISAVSVGNGFVRTNGTTYQQMAAFGGLSAVGYSSGIKYRSYIQWDTSSLPKNLVVQSVGLFINVVNSYGAGNTVSINQLTQPVGSLLTSQTGLAQLYNDLGNNPHYLTGVTAFQTPGAKVIPLGNKLAGSQIVTDLQNAINSGTPFSMALAGSNEVNAMSTWYAKQDTTHTDLHPALVIFYSGVLGEDDGPVRPLRTGFFDGTNYWQFFKAAGGQFYAYSPDGNNWKIAGKVDSDVNRHFGLWYNGGNTFLYTYSAHTANTPVNNNNLVLLKGTISGTAITWTNLGTVFASSTTSGSNSGIIDGYDFPSVITDSNNNCWIIARHYQGTNSLATAGLEVKESTDSGCTSWGTTTSLIDLSTATGGVHGHGGYLVPLPNGQVYAVYKDILNGTNPILYGKLFNGTSWGNTETVDNNVAFGVYLQGVSAVAAGNTVYISYIAGNGSVVFNSRTNNIWGTPVTLNSSGNFFTPVMSLDSTNGNLYLFYRQPGNNNQVNGSLYFQQGNPTGNSVNWSSPILLANTWTPVAGMVGDARWEMSVNYSSAGKPFVSFTDGLYGLKVIPVIPLP